MDKAEMVRIVIFFNRFFKSLRLTENTSFLCESNNTIDSIDVYLGIGIGQVSQTFI